jgi:trimeric autotransporter adhesin
MNRNYRLVFNRSVQAWQAVAEFVRACGKSKSQSQHRSTVATCLPKLKKLAVCIALSQTSGMAYALPSGADVQFGQATFQTIGNNLSINQGTKQLIANWQSFGIAANESVQLLQPNLGVALFRVVGPEASQIYGSLSTTGSLFLINPNGVLFGQGAQVDVGNLVSTSMSISNTDFLNGHYQFNADGSTGGVINQGVIKASDGGYIILLGNEVKNSGTLTADNGSVVMGSAQSAMLDFYGNGLVKAKLSGDALGALVEQTGTIQADGGTVQLATNSRSSAVNVSGLVQANSLVERNGVIRLEGGDNAKVSISSALSAAGNQAGTKGGTIEVTGEQVALFKGAKLDASGDAGGGNVLVGGDYQGKNAEVYNSRTTYVDKDASINVDAKNSGNGGKAVVWADEVTRYYGSISAKGGKNEGNGGFAEVSGKRLLNFLGKVDLSAVNGVGGNLLLDPLNITLTTADANTNGFTSPGDITEAFADDAGLTSTFRVNAGGSFAGIAAGSTITLQATNDINVNTAFNVTTATGSANNSLVLQANNNINVNAAVTTTGTGSITMNANADNLGGGNLVIGANNITSQAGGIALSGVNITKTTGTIISTGAANSNGGNISIAATGTANLGTGAITANGGAGAVATAGGNAGNINITAAGAITTGAVTATGGAAGAGNAAGGNAGLINISTTLGNIATAALAASTGAATGTGAGGIVGGITVNNTAVAGNISLGALTTSGGANGNAGNISANATGVLTLNGAIAANAGNNVAATVQAGKNAGAITLTGNSITSVAAATINANGGAGLGANQAGGNGAAVSLNATGAISVRAITANGGNGVATNAAGGNAGSISIATNNGNITTNAGALNARTGTGVGTGADSVQGFITVNNTSATGTIATGAINTAGNINGHGGNVSVTANGNVTVGTVSTSGGGTTGLRAGRNAGNIMIAGATRTIGAITASGSNGVGANQNGGNAGMVSITGTGTVTAATITATGGNGVATNAKGGNAGTITVSTNAGNITTGALTARTGAGIGTGADSVQGFITVNNTSAAGTVNTAAINTSGQTNGNGGNVTLSSLGTTTAGTIATSGATSTGVRTGRVAGSVSVTGAAVTTGAITANGAAGIGLNQAGGNAGAVSLTATTGAIVTQAVSAVGGAGVATNANGGNGGAVNLDAGTGSTVTMNNINTTGGNRAGTGTAGIGGNITVADNALLSANSTITATGGSAGGASGTINFAGTINSVGASRTLAINTAAATTLAGAIGSTFALTSITTNAGGTTAINGGAVTTTGGQTYGDATTLGAATTFATTNSNVTFGSSINAGGNNVVIAAGTGAVSATNAANNFGNLAITAGSANIRDTNAIVLGATNVTGAYTLQTNGAITQSAAVTVAGLTTLNAGVANDITLNNIANNFNSVAITNGRDVNIVDANALTMNASSVRTITARTLSSDLTLGGNITATGAGNAIVLASAGNFINASNSNLAPGTGRWLVYSTDPTLDNRGAGLLAAYDFKQYNTVFGGAVAGTGDGFIYTLAPTITPTLTGSATKGYDGTTTAPIGSLTLGQTGAIDGDTITLMGLSSATYDDRNAGVGKTVSASGISFIGTGANNGGKTVYGYQLASPTATGAVGTINQRAITVTANPGQSKIFGAADPLPFTFTVGGLGLVGGDTLSGSLDRLSGETVGNYAINQGTLEAGANYTINYIGNTFAILAPANGSPRDTAGLGSLLALNDRPLQGLSILNVAAPAAGSDPDVENSVEACEANTNPKLNNPNNSIIFNFGIKLPKGVKPVCI